MADRPSIDPVMDVQIRSGRLLDQLLIRHPDAAAGASWDGDVLTLRVVGDPDVSDSPAGKLRADLKASGIPASVRIVSAKFTSRAIAARADEVRAQAALWVSSGLKGLAYVWPDDLNGRVVLGIEQPLVGAWRERVSESLPGDIPVTVTGEKDSSIDFQSRDDDIAPWSGGITIKGDYFSGPAPWESPARCTSGFNWRRWGGLGTAMGMAEHCINVDSGAAAGNNYKPWRNAGVLVGTPVVTAPNVDGALLQGSGQTYSASVYLGPANSNDVRVVVSSDPTDQVGDHVAVSGSVSGQVLSTVMAANVSYGGLTLTVMQSEVTQDGDSGAPWLQTNSNGTVIAKGQHVGAITFQGLRRSVYMQNVRISAAVSASILTN